ncbi:MAG: hypothetical protein DMG21_04380 [Acidobacteria bacterium]|nr:MAG: hypothetical protein DMG21_04380 [Acidobacteriota bacterium]
MRQAFSTLTPPRSPAARKESRGAHCRSDFPLKDESHPARNSYIARHTPALFA